VGSIHAAREGEVRRRIRKVGSIRAAEEGDVSRQRGEGSSNRATEEGRGPRTTLLERVGEIESRRWENIAATLSANYYNYFNIFHFQ
jgi:hypothetical protein